MPEVIENTSGPGHAQLILHSIRASFPANFAGRIAGDDHRGHRAQLGRSGEFCLGRERGEERAEALHPALDERRSFSIRNFRYETGASDWRCIPADLDLSAGNAGLRADAEHGSTPRQGFGHSFDEDLAGRPSGRHLPDAHWLPADAKCSLPGNRGDRGEVPGRRIGASRIHQGLLAGQCRIRIPRAAVPATLTKRRRPVATVLVREAFGRGRKTAARTHLVCRGPVRKTESVREFEDAPRGLRGSSRVPAMPSTSTKSGRSIGSCTATVASVAERCWPERW